MRKINVTNPIVEIDGDEMARNHLAAQVRDELIDAYLDMELRVLRSQPGATATRRQTSHREGGSKRSRPAGRDQVRDDRPRPARRRELSLRRAAGRALQRHDPQPFGRRHFP